MKLEESMGTMFGVEIVLRIDIEKNSCRFEKHYKERIEGASSTIDYARAEVFKRLGKSEFLVTK